MSDRMQRAMLKILIKLRWAYFHVSPFYRKFYMDSDRTEAHFFHARTNSIHSNYVLRNVPLSERDRSDGGVK